MNNYAIRLNAGNDANGNPRRVFVVMDIRTGSIVKAIDEGYSGMAALTKEFPLINTATVTTFNTTTAEYRNLLKNFR